uniref:Fructokinase n=1 Tax=Candidatus Kentrum sp. TUN TaxID=2126343 RepID=A0A451A1J9_9GAMM|nr:MAG: fructokinase [Candidatus Kentron sp. TUN]
MNLWQRHEVTRDSSISLPRISGTGFAALDLIFPYGSDPEETEAAYLAAAGGTCANILLTLVQLGLRVSFLSRLGHDPAGMEISIAFRRAGADVSPIHHDKTIFSPVILQYLRSSDQGGHDHWFSRSYRGRKLPKYVSVTNDQVESAIPILEQSWAFVFDRLTVETLNAVRTAHASGALILFEPSSIEDVSLFRSALAYVDILKFSSKRLDDQLSKAWLTEVPVVIRTLGEIGLEVSFRDRPDLYHYLPAINAPRITDSCGSGDMVTAGLLFWLAIQEGRDQQIMLQGIRKGQKLAAMNCAFVGARGIFHAMDVASIKHFWLDASMQAWLREIRRINPTAGYTRIERESIFLTLAPHGGSPLVLG